MKGKLKAQLKQFQQVAIDQAKLLHIKGGDDSIVVEDYIDG